MSLHKSLSLLKEAIGFGRRAGACSEQERLHWQCMLGAGQ